MADERKPQAGSGGNNRLGELLVRENLISPLQLQKAMETQRASGGRLGHQLTKLGYIEENELTSFLSKQYSVPSINLRDFEIDGEVLKLVPKEVVVRHQVLPINKSGNTLIVAMADPSNIYAIDDIKFITNFNMDVVVASEAQIAEAIEKYYTSNVTFEDVMVDFAGEEDVELGGDVDEDINVLDLEKSAGDAPVVKLVNLVLLDAIRKGASDIHIEPYEKQLRIRYRIDGMLYEVMKPPLRLKHAITSRLKIMSNLDIAERRLPQDGRFRIRVSGKEVDLRISILPTVYGEKIVIRLLDKGALSASVEALGMDAYTLGVFKKAIDAPHGMILVTGPTGSGKTTTLYSVLSELNSPEYNIVTVEDPIEYQLPGINQVAVKAEIGLSFADALRSILRQDPDIVMIGEIRDNETADIAVKAALTGHQVLSTLHTNDAAGAISRLDDMGIEPFLISSSILLTCAQRLVRKICPNCREEYRPEPELFERLGIEDDGATFYHGAGCDRCKRRGYVGRAAVIEVLPVSEQIRRLIIKRASAAVVKNQAISEGMKTLRMVGIDKAKEGITTLEEVLKTTSDDH